MIPPERVITGATVSILATVAVIDPVLPEPSTKVKMNDPLVAKVCVDPPVLVTVITSLAPVRVAMTD
jgi:hypothetical protein